MNGTEITEALKARRKELDWSQEKAAEKADMTNQTVSKIENKQAVNLETLTAYADALGMEIIIGRWEK
jgi:transcriptional regulator with XRE-family HTH domain